MKLTYVIVPAENTGHLARCINSLYRQDEKNFDVILAENVFEGNDEELEKIIVNAEKLKKISDNAVSYEEKIKEAISMIDVHSDYVMFVDVTSVTAPICSRAVCRYRGADVIMPLTAVKEDDKFETVRLSLSDVIEQIDLYDPTSFCFKYSLVKDMPADVFTDRSSFSVFMLSVFVTSDSLPITDDICFYMEEKRNVEKVKPTIEGVAQSESLVIDRFAEAKNAAIKTAVFEKLFRDISCLFFDGDTDRKKEAFGLMQTLCVGVSEDILLKKVFELEAGCSTDIFLKLYYDEYEIYRDRVFAVTSERYIPQINIYELKKSIVDTNDRLNEISAELADMKKNMASMFRLNQSQGMQSGKNAHIYNDPMSEIPALYSQGRLGFKVIWRSFTAWLGYKFRRKK